jgi:ABC-2 type transport system permease protein
MRLLRRLFIKLLKLAIMVVLMVIRAVLPQPWVWGGDLLLWVLLFLLGWSLAVLSGFANVYFRDTQHLCEVGFQILFYATPIVWMPVPRTSRPDANLRRRGILKPSR